MRALVLMVSLFLTSNVFAEKSIEVIKKTRFGDWTVVKFKDKMSDKLACVSIIEKYDNVSISEAKLNLPVSEDTESFRARIDSKPMTDFLKPEFNKSGGLTYVDEKFGELAMGSRLRLEVLQKSGKTEFYDFSLKGMLNSYEFMKNQKCL